jgi:hypothetical protein
VAGVQEPGSSGNDDRIPRGGSEQYRLFAVEPHGWSSVLVQDRHGAIYIVATAVRSLHRISIEQAELSLTQRKYRLWHGSREWAPLDALPLIAGAFGSAVSPEMGEGAH